MQSDLDLLEWGKHLSYKYRKEIRMHIEKRGEFCLLGKHLSKLDTRFKTLYSVPVFRFFVEDDWCGNNVLKWGTITVFKKNNESIGIYDTKYNLLNERFNIKYLEYQSGIGGFCLVNILNKQNVVTSVSVNDDHILELEEADRTCIKGYGIIPSDYVRTISKQPNAVYPARKNYKEYLEYANTLGKGVYLIRCEGLYKIGCATKVKNRLAELQVGNPSELILVDFKPCDNNFDVEKAIHRAFASKKVRGEWFKLNFQDVDSFVSGYGLNTQKRWDLGLQISDHEREYLAECDEENWNYPGSPYTNEFWEDDD